jgi:hypothetical protein
MQTRQWSLQKQNKDKKKYSTGLAEINDLVFVAWIWWKSSLILSGVDTTDSITENMCKQSKTAFNDPDDFSENGGVKV